MTSRLKPKLTAVLTTIALIALPATDAFAGQSWRAMRHRSHAHHASVRYVLGNNWKTPTNTTHGHRTRLHYIVDGRNWN